MLAEYAMVCAVKCPGTAMRKIATYNILPTRTTKLIADSSFASDTSSISEPGRDGLFLLDKHAEKSYYLFLHHPAFEGADGQP
jgi:hypothetical protein